LGIVHGLSYLKEKKSDYNLYSDSKIAINRVHEGECKTKLPHTAETEKLFELVEELFPERRSPFPPKDEWLKAKRWKGESLTNKHLVIWSEFGLGDEIMFAQLAHMLKLQGTKKITLVAQKPIVSLLQT